MGSARRLKNSSILPPELARKISPLTVNVAQMGGPTAKAVFMAVAGFMLYGSGMGRAEPDYNGYVYLLGPWIFPYLISILWYARLVKLPWKLYRGNPFGAHTYVDIGKDPAAMRLAVLFKSDEARQHLWRETLGASLILFTVLGTAAIYYRHSLQWVLPSPQNHFLGNLRIGESGSQFWVSVTCCTWAMFMMLIPDYYRWCLTTWAKRERDHTPVTAE
jgi:hypothetical protein